MKWRKIADKANCDSAVRGTTIVTISIHKIYLELGHKCVSKHHSVLKLRFLTVTQ